MQGTKRILVVGPSQSGKTALVSGNIPQTRDKSIVRQFRNERPGGFVFVTDPHRNFDCRERFEWAEDLYSVFRGNPVPDVYCLSFEDELSWDAGLKLIYTLADTGMECSLIVDELLDLSSARSSQPSFTNFIRYGRHRGINLCYCSMRPVNVDGLLRANVNEVYAFRQNHEDDIEALSKIGFIGERTEDTRYLKQFEYIHFRESDVFKLKSGAENADTNNGREGEIDEAEN